MVWLRIWVQPGLHLVNHHAPTNFGMAGVNVSGKTMWISCITNGWEWLLPRTPFPF